MATGTSVESFTLLANQTQFYIVFPKLKMRKERDKYLLICNRCDVFTAKPEKAAFPSTGFKIASWLWRNGYVTSSSAGLRKYCDGTTYGFLQLSFEIHRKTEHVARQLEYWWETLKVRTAVPGNNPFVMQAHFFLLVSFATDRAQRNKNE